MGLRLYDVYAKKDFMFHNCSTKAEEVRNAVADMTAKALSTVEILISTDARVLFLPYLIWAILDSKLEEGEKLPQADVCKILGLGEFANFQIHSPFVPFDQLYSEQERLQRPPEQHSVSAGSPGPAPLSQEASTQFASSQSNRNTQSLAPPESEPIAIRNHVAETPGLQPVLASPPTAISGNEAETLTSSGPMMFDVRRLQTGASANARPSSETWSENTGLRDRVVPHEASESRRFLQGLRDSVPHSPALPVDRLLDTSPSSPHMTSVQQQQRVLESNQPLQFPVPSSDRALPENGPREILSHSTSMAPNSQDQSEYIHTRQDLSACNHAPGTQNHNHPATPSVQEQADCRAQMQIPGFLPGQPESSQPRSHATEAAGVEAPEGGDVLTRASSRDTPRSAYNNPLDDTSFWDDLLDEKEQASMDTLFSVLDANVVD
ncbi:hypothetical protein MRS44_018138 [Fusarium solani]|uniref:uncharacterized protein n=1 Tax=Fusarium solani TaxID=169388 RepID=UPI0032C45E29|nr:hypothetical protein MRS44_018138 [Fusarium solani]